MAPSPKPVEEDELEEHLAVFKIVIANLPLQHVPPMASAIRRTNSGTSTTVDCEVLSPPLFGSYHILFPVHFVDGVRWLLKIPAIGYPGRWDVMGARGLTSEALTMRFLQRQTKIPIPKVFHFDSSLDNELKSPFIFLEFIEGIPLFDCWHNDAISKDLLEQRRVKILQQLAATMVQLDKFTYDKCGQLTFDEQQMPNGVESIEFSNEEAALKRLKTDNPDEAKLGCELGPFEDTKSVFLCVLNRHVPTKDQICFSQGIDKLLRLFISWMPLPPTEDYTLSHPDFNFQNILVSEDGDLRGLIDWDGVGPMPRCIGNRALPSWLTRDWDPAMYRWPPVDGGCPEDSPDELARYRGIYARAIGEACSGSQADVSLTLNSNIYENIRIAAGDQMVKHHIVLKVLEEITRLVAPECLEEDDLGNGTGEGSVGRDGKDGAQGGGNDDGINGEEEGCTDGDGEDYTDGDAVEAAGECAGGVSKEGDRTLSEDDTAAKASEIDIALAAGLAESTIDEPDEPDESDDDADSLIDFYFWAMAPELAQDKLDEERMAMLKDGFLRLFV